MRKWLSLIALCGSFVPGAVHAQAEIDCKSAKMPSVDLKTYFETCDARAAAERAGTRRATTLAADPISVFNARTTLAGVSLTNVPAWSNADILAQFPLIRDKRYLSSASNPTFLRRISWLYPDDGCHARAEQVNAQAVQAGKAKPHKLFAMGQLRAFTDNNPTGVVTWAWHVASVVKNSASEPIVFDAALSPCRPLPWKEWLGLLTGDINDFNNTTQGWGVVVGDPNSYTPFTLVSGEPSHAADSINELKVNFLPKEWDRQSDLGRNPNAVLGTSQPWGGYACVTASATDLVSATVAPNATKTLTATCPFGTLATGGGISAPQGFLVTKNAKSSDNGWTITARNNTSASAELDVHAVCLTGAPLGATVTTATGNTATVLPNLNNSSSASCASGTLIGGGYLTTGTSPIMRVYSNKRSTSTSSTWQVFAQNTTTTSKSITAYAYCLANTSFTFSQVTGSAVANGIYSSAYCSPKTILGGGYAFPRTAAYQVDFMSNYGPEIWLTTMAGAPASQDPNAVGYAECLAHP